MAMKRKNDGNVRKSATFAGFTARAVMCIAAGLLVLSFLSILVNPAKIWVMTLFGLLFIPLFTVNVVLFFWALKRRSRSAFIPLVAVLPSLFFVGSYFQFAGNDEESSGEKVKVVSYNVGRFMNGKCVGGRYDREECIDSVMRFLDRQKADIICLQEFYIQDINELRAFLSKRMKKYGYEYYLYTGKSGSYGNITLSRFAAKDKGVIKFDNSANLAIYTDYQIDDDRIRVYNCHFESYNISPSGLLRSVLGRDREKIKKAEDKMIRGISRRPKQVNRVLDHIGHSEYDSFVCGDFNDTPMSYTYYKMSKGREDSFRESGKGFAATFSLLWPMIRIDYVLYPERFQALSHITYRKPFSDHYPVVTEIEL